MQGTLVQIGQQYGKLTVIEQVGSIKRNGYDVLTWKCVCNCNNTNTIILDSIKLRSKNGAKTCGCGRFAKKPNVSKKLIGHKSYNSKCNTYDLSGEYGIGYTTNNQTQFYFDLEDYDKIKDYHWRINSNGYIYTTICSNGKRKHQILAYLILPNEDVIYYIHGDDSRYDNRKSNLRPSSWSNALCGRPIRSDNTSGVTGVRQTVIRGKNVWIAQLMKNGKTYRKVCKTKEEAILVRKNMEEKYFNIHSYDNRQNY